MSQRFFLLIISVTFIVSQFAIVIAGLITDMITDSTRSVSFLGDIPVLGTLFKQTVQEKRKSELVILMTPYVLNDHSIEDIRKEHEERLRKAGRTFEAVPAVRWGSQN